MNTRYNINEEAILEQNLIVPEIIRSAKKIKYESIKRILDIVISSIGLVLLLPVFLILALIIKIDSKGPIIYAHKRIGKNGKEIKIYKFRTMYENANEMIKDFTEEQLEEWKTNFKLKDDPRVTKFGNI